MSEILDKIKTRRSIRKFKPDQIPSEILNLIIEAGTYAATGRNRQSPVIIAVTDKDTIAKLSKQNAQIGGWEEGFDPFYGAPVVLIILADRSAPTYIYDGSLVMGNLMLAAHDLGIGSCWIHRAKEEFEMPEWQNWLNFASFIFRRRCHNKLYQYLSVRYQKSTPGTEENSAESIETQDMAFFTETAR